MKRLLTILLLMASSAHGEVYTWIDGKGTAHYTNSVYEIPARYRARAKTLNLGTEPPADRALSSQPAPQLPQPVVPQAVIPQQKSGPVQIKGIRSRRHSGTDDE